MYLPCIFAVLLGALPAPRTRRADGRLGHRWGKAAVRSRGQRCPADLSRDPRCPGGSEPAPPVAAAWQPRCDVLPDRTAATEGSEEQVPQRQPRGRVGLRGAAMRRQRVTGTVVGPSLSAEHGDAIPSRLWVFLWTSVTRPRSPVRSRPPSSGSGRSTCPSTTPDTATARPSRRRPNTTSTPCSPPTSSDRSTSSRPSSPR